MEKSAEIKQPDLLQVKCERSYLRCITQGMHFVTDHQIGLLRILWLAITLDAVLHGFIGVFCVGDHIWVSSTLYIARWITAILFWLYMGVILRKVDELGYIPSLHPWQLIKALPDGFKRYIPRMANVKKGMHYLFSTLLILVVGLIVVLSIQLVATLPAAYLTYISWMSYVAEAQGDATGTPEYLPLLQFAAYFLTTFIFRLALPLMVFPLLLQWGRIVSHTDKPKTAEEVK